MIKEKNISTETFVDGNDNASDNESNKNIANDEVKNTPNNATVDAKEDAKNSSANATNAALKKPKNNVSNLSVLATTAATIGAFLGVGPVGILAAIATTMLAGSIMDNLQNNASKDDAHKDTHDSYFSSLMGKYTFFKRSDIAKKKTTDKDGDAEPK